VVKGEKEECEGEGGREGAGEERRGRGGRWGKIREKFVNEQGGVATRADCARMYACWCMCSCRASHGGWRLRGQS
jgi:hypothetical protein